MIFVTVGTHEQPFNRLLEEVDELKSRGVISEEVLMQTGYSTYTPNSCQHKQWIPYSEMISNVQEARIVITHGGPSSFMMPLQIGKTPIVVPRKMEFGEHINNHQVKFCRAVAERYGSVFVVEDIGSLEELIVKYDALVKSMPGKAQSNNAKFNAGLEKIVEGMF